MIDLSGKVCVVTGGGGAIGAIAVDALINQGADVVICGRDLGRLQRVAERAPDRIRPVEMTVTDEADWRRLGDELAAGWSDPPAVLVTAAGINHRGPFVASEYEEWQAMWQTNVVGTLLACRSLLPGMLAAGFGRLILVSSAGAHIGLTERAVYTATKGAIEAFGRSLAAEVAGGGVTVNCVAPGAMPTDLTRGWLEERPDLRDRMLDDIPAGRFGNPAELRAAFDFLVASDYSTGSSVIVDGGWTAV